MIRNNTKTKWLYDLLVVSSSNISKIPFQNNICFTEWWQKFFALACKAKSLAFTFVFLDGLTSFLLIFHRSLPRTHVTSTGLISLDKLENNCLKCLLDLKFRVWEHDAPCALENIVMAVVNKHIQSRKSHEYEIPHLRVTYNDELLPIISHDPLTTCSSEISRQTKTIISPLPLWPWPPTLAEWWLTLRGS